MNTNKEVEWRRFIVPKKLNKLMTTYSYTLTSQIKQIDMNEMRVNDSEMSIR